MDFTLADLLTVPGAAAAAVAIVKAATTYFGLPKSRARAVVLTLGVGLLVGASAVTAGFDVAVLVGAIPAGLSAGFAAIAAYDAATSGLDYAVIPAEDYLRSPGPK